MDDESIYLKSLRLPVFFKDISLDFSHKLDHKNKPGFLHGLCLFHTILVNSLVNQHMIVSFRLVTIRKLISTFFPWEVKCNVLADSP